MTTTILHNDVIGTSYQHSRWDVSRLRATRKLIVKSNQPIEDQGADSSDTTQNSIVGELTAVTGVAGSYQTLIGPLWVEPDGDDADQQQDWEIVHPDNNMLPLQSIGVSSMGDQRYLVTLEYFIVPGTQGGGAGSAVTVQFRAEMYARKSYYRAEEITAQGTQELVLIPENLSVTAGSPEAYGRTEMVPQVKIQIPFARNDNPITSTTVQKVGGLNVGAVTIGGKQFLDKQVRFDGVQMDEYGTTTSSNGQTFRFKGFYEFTARGGLGFKETVYVPGEVQSDGTQKYQQKDVWENIQPYTTAMWTLTDLGV